MQLSIYTFKNGFSASHKTNWGPRLSLGQVSLQESWKPQALSQPQLSQLTTNPCV